MDPFYDDINAASVVRLLGVSITPDLFLGKHISMVSSTCFFQLRRVRRSLDIDSASTLVHAYVTSRVNYCNSMLVGALKIWMDKLLTMHFKCCCTSGNKNTKVRPRPDANSRSCIGWMSLTVLHANCVFRCSSVSTDWRHPISLTCIDLSQTIRRRHLRSAICGTLSSSSKAVHIWEAGLCICRP